MELGPEEVSLLEGCPHFRGCYVQASMARRCVPIREVSSFLRVFTVYRLQWSWDLKIGEVPSLERCPHFRGCLFNPLSPSTHHSPPVLQECVGLGHPELVGLVLRYRDQQQAKLRSQEIPQMLERLQSTPDYYIEMRWEVSSWGEWAS